MRLRGDDPGKAEVYQRDSSDVAAPLPSRAEISPMPDAPSSAPVHGIPGTRTGVSGDQPFNGRPRGISGLPTRPLEPFALLFCSRGGGNEHEDNH